MLGTVRKKKEEKKARQAGDWEKNTAKIYENTDESSGSIEEILTQWKPTEATGLKKKPGKIEWKYW